MRGSVEVLEARIAPAPLVVSSLADSGPGSLRQAILDANADGDADEITFKRAGVIRLLSELPAITADVAITAAKRVKVDALLGARVFEISGAGLDVVIAGLELRRGAADVGGALLMDAAGGTLELRGVKVKNSLAREDAGGLAAGGALAVLAGTVMVEGGGFSGNRAVSPEGQAYGGAVYNLGTVSFSQGTKLVKNSANGLDAAGGAVFNGLLGSATLSGVKLKTNAALGTTGTSGDDGERGEHGADGGRGEDGEPGGDGEPGTDGTDGGEGRGGRRDFQ